jgi:N-acetylmuramic acid 6-phosphate etherase
MIKQANTKNDISITELPSNFEDLDKMTVNELLTNINHEDAKVHVAVKKALPQIEKLINQILVRMQRAEGSFTSGLAQVAGWGCWMRPRSLPPSGCLTLSSSVLYRRRRNSTAQGGGVGRRRSDKGLEGT